MLIYLQRLVIVWLRFSYSTILTSHQLIFGLSTQCDPIGYCRSLFPDFILRTYYGASWLATPIQSGAGNLQADASYWPMPSFYDTCSASGSVLTIRYLDKY